MSLADPFTMPDYRERLARYERGGNRDSFAPIDRRHRYEGPLGDPRVQPFDARKARGAFILRTVVELAVCALCIGVVWAVLG